MAGDDDRQREYFAALYKSHRWQEGVRGWRWVDLPPAVIAGVIGVLLAPDLWSRILVGVVSGAAGGFLWQVILLAVRWVVTAPTALHVEQALRIETLEAELRAVLAGQSSQASNTVKALIAFHVEGAGLRGRIRGHGHKPWNKDLKTQAKDWEHRVITFIESSVPQFRGRFVSDTPRTLQGFQPGASQHVSTWGNFMDRRLDNLQSIIEQLAGAQV